MKPASQYTAVMPLTIGFLALAALVFGLGGWSIRTQIAGAVIAQGIVVVENNRQVIQHSEGGIIGKVAARDGDVVAKGDLLLSLDETLLRSELAIASLGLVELRARRARLEAERDGADAVVFPPNLNLSGDMAAAEQIAGQRVLFEARRQTFEKELDQIAEQIEQSQNRIAGAEAQLAALHVQRTLAQDELAVQEKALERGVTQALRVSTLKREEAGLAGEIGKLQADIAQYRGQIATFVVERVKLRNARREAAIAELRDIQFRELELAEQRRSLEKRLERLQIRAPVSGIVYGSSVFSESAVVQAAEPLMYVIPQDQPLIIAARIEAIHVEQVHIGQSASLRFTAFDQRLTPVIAGNVLSVSADVFQDDVTGLRYYKVDLVPDYADLERLGGQKLLPGMPVEAFLKTGERTPLSYLTKPLTDYFGRAFRES